MRASARDFTGATIGRVAADSYVMLFRNSRCCGATEGHRRSRRVIQPAYYLITQIGTLSFSSYNPVA